MSSKIKITWTWWPILASMVTGLVHCGTSDEDGGFPSAGGSTGTSFGGAAGAAAAGGQAGGGGSGGEGGADPCAAHCDNHTQDCGEEGTDCGGSCAPCEDGLVIRGRWLGLAGADGNWRVLLTTGHLRPEAGLLADLTNSGKNGFHNNQSGAGNSKKESAQAYVNNDLQAGWNESFWTSLRELFEQTAAVDIATFVGVWGTVALEGDRTVANCWKNEAWSCRWDVNPWNANVGQGGPYQLPGCGKDAFYTFNDYGQVLYQPGDAYPAGADMSSRGQWRQEEYIHRLATLCSEFPHVAISLMWEASDLGSHNWGACQTSVQKVRSWHQHMRDYIKSLSPNTLVATGSGPILATDFDMLDFLTTEANAKGTFHLWASSGWNLPVVTSGWTAWEGSTNCKPVCDPSVYPFVRERIQQAWADGLQVGSPFWEYHDGEVEAAALDPYFVQLRQFVDGVQSWSDEPGNEVTLSTLPTP